MTIRTAATATTESATNKPLSTVANSLTATAINDAIGAATAAGVNRADVALVADLSGDEPMIKQSDDSLISLDAMSLYVAELGYRESNNITNSTTIKFSIAWD
jgi:hypothetical protein